MRCIALQGAWQASMPIHIHLHGWEAGAATIELSCPSESCSKESSSWVIAAWPGQASDPSGTHAKSV
eukprot:3806482-Pyramimonas_sp.AAC.1